MIFWGALLLAPAFWALCAITLVFRFLFDWLLVVLIAVALLGANIVGYVKCARGRLHCLD
jgi:hypothetical protein